MRIGIANDSMIACEVLRRVVRSGQGLEVAWVARDGAEAVALARAEPADLVLMDLFMPQMDGVEATRRIMGEAPCAILVVTATVAGHIGKVYQAMGYGALDAVDTPVLGLAGEVDGSNPLLRKIEVIGRLIGKVPSAPARASAAPAPGPVAWEPSLPPLVVIGASTGGPFALAAILAGLPADLEAGVVIVQHVDATFAPGLGRWLADNSRRRVELADDGRAPARGDVLLSGTNDHLVLDAGRRLRHTPEPASLAYRPSVDVFFESVARHWPSPGVAVLLTGMGRDGAEGLLALRKLGWRTIAQDRDSCVVWGMPRAAVERGAAEQVLPLSRIAGAIASALAYQNEARAQARPAPR